MKLWRKLKLESNGIQLLKICVLCANRNLEFRQTKHISNLTELNIRKQYNNICIEIRSVEVITGRVGFMSIIFSASFSNHTASVTVYVTLFLSPISYHGPRWPENSFTKAFCCMLTSYTSNSACKCHYQQVLVWFSGSFQLRRLKLRYWWLVCGVWASSSAQWRNFLPRSGW